MEFSSSFYFMSINYKLINYADHVMDITKILQIYKYFINTLKNLLIMPMI